MISNLDYYKIFYHVASCENITAAAKLLFLSQPTVSRCIQNLENELGCQLFVRSKKGAFLTPEGQMLYSHVKQAWDHISTGEQQLSQLKGLSSGFVRIGASEMTLRHFLLPRLAAFRKEYPSIRIQISSYSTPEALEALEKGSIDLAVIISPLENEENFHVVRLDSFQDIAVAGSAFSHLKTKKMSLQELNSYPLISMQKNTTTRQFWDKIFEAGGEALHPDIELPTSDLLIPMAAHNLGIAFTPENYAGPYLEDGVIFTLSTDFPIPRRHICAVANPGLTISLAGKAFWQMITG